MRGVSIPTHEYARVADLYTQTMGVHPTKRDPSLIQTVRQFTAATRAYTRVVLRLRAQAEKDASTAGSAMKHHRSGSMKPASKPPVTSPQTRTNSSRIPSRAPSPAMSMYSQAPTSQGRSSSPTSVGFKSPLYRLRRAPLLRVFVPSPDGDWLSDASVLECEAELKRAGVQNLVRLGDVIWDIAVGDEGNVGRLVWDGSYLIVSISTTLPRIFLSKANSRISITRTRQSAIFQSTCPTWLFRLRTSTELFALERIMGILLFDLILHPGEKK
jgi:hypothetical protein